MSWQDNMKKIIDSGSYDSEIERANKVIKEKKAKGEDTTAQERYKTQLTNLKSSGGGSVSDVEKGNYDTPVKKDKDRDKKSSSSSSGNKSSGNNNSSNYNPWDGSKYTQTPALDKLASSFLDVIKDIAKNNSTGKEVDMGVAKDMFETDIKNSGNADYKRYGSFEVTDDLKNNYGLAMDDTIKNMDDRNRNTALAYARSSNNKEAEKKLLDSAPSGFKIDERAIQEMMNNYANAVPKQPTTGNVANDKTSLSNSFLNANVSGSNLDLNNEKKYLEGLYQNGDEGEKEWALQKAKEYGITLGQPESGPVATDTSNLSNSFLDYQQQPTMNIGNSAYTDTSSNNTEIDELKKKLADYMDNSMSPEEIYEQIMENMPKAKEQKTLSYEEALAQAKNQYNPLYKESMDNVLSELDKKALRSGFYGQLPYEQVKRNTASEIETKKNSAISNLATSLLGESKAEADRKSQLDMQEQQSRLNTIMSALQGYASANNTNIGNMFNMLGLMTQEDQRNKDNAYRQSESDFNRLMSVMQYKDSKDSKDFEKSLAEANLTGFYKGSPTLALTKYMDQFNMDRQKMELAEKQANASISQAWSRIANDKAQQDFYKSKWESEFGLALEDNKLSRDKFIAGIKLDALSATNDYFQNQGYMSMDEVPEEEFNSVFERNYNSLINKTELDKDVLK